MKKVVLIILTALLCAGVVSPQQIQQAPAQQPPAKQPPVPQ
jgi:uncharacterized protein YcfL